MSEKSEAISNLFKSGVVGNLISFGREPIEQIKRTNKGKNIIEPLPNYVSVDLETTGLDPGWDNIIEIAAVRVENNEVADQFQTLINPGFEIDEFITNLTGITNDMLSSAPPLSDVLQGFIDFIGDGTVVAHNANFDINFIYDNCLKLLKHEFNNNFIDTMRISRRLFKQEKHHRLKDLVVRFKIAKKIEHRAISDAEQVYRCYEYLKQYALDNSIDFSSLYPSHKQIKADDISTQITEFNTETSVYGKYFVFTGTLEKMLRKEAMQIVVDMGGLCLDSVNKNTNFLVLGNMDYTRNIKDGKSNKQKKAEQLKLAGADIETISENVFYEMIAESAMGD